MIRPLPRLSQLLSGGGVPVLEHRGPDPEVAALTLDSRRVQPGSLFLALQGEHTSGLAFVADAVARGAVGVVGSSAPPAELPRHVAWVRVDDPRSAAALLAREHSGRPDAALTLVGVTGTNGKTTVTYLVEAMGRAAGRSCGRIGTVSSAFGGIERPAVRTTPEAPDFYRLLAEMRDAGVELVAIEVSSHALSLERVGGARFAVGAFLNLGRDHLDFHGTREAYFAAKARLFEELGSEQVAVLPADTAEGRELARRTRARILRFGRGESAEFRLREEHHSVDGSSAVLETPSGRLPLRTRLIGRFNLDNAAAAAACAYAAGLPPEAVTSGAAALDRVPGRVERVHAGQPFTVVVDYAHTEEALRGVLESLRALAPARLHVVFGCGGERDTGKRAPMGRVAAECADLVVVTSDNPRGEEPQAILTAILEGVALVPGGTQRTRTIVDRRAAIEAALADAAPGDVVLLAGKGHEDTLTVAGRREPFDDREVAKDVLARLGYQGGAIRA